MARKHSCRSAAGAVAVAAAAIAAAAARALLAFVASLLLCLFAALGVSSSMGWLAIGLRPTFFFAGGGSRWEDGGHALNEPLVSVRVRVRDRVRVMVMVRARARARARVKA